MKTKIELSNGKAVDGSLGIMALKALRHKDKNLYTEANRIVATGAKTVEDVLNAAYAGYVACCEDKPEYSFDEFISLLPDSASDIAEIVTKMI